jgi:hypothetical protein
MSKFLFYGCWNNINCEKEYIYRDLVLNYIHKKEKKISTFFIAGDNWYSTKVTKVNESTTNLIQYYLLSILKTGYDKLYQLNKTIHIAAGNHDEHNDGNGEPLKSRCMIKTQKKYIDKLNEKIFDSSVSKSYDKLLPTYSKFISSNDELSSTLFVNNDMDGFNPTLEELSELQKLDIHDNIMNIYVDEIGIVNNEKYIVIIINTNKLNYPNYLRAIQYKFKYVNRIKAHKQVFVMGHVPLFALKKNKIKDKNELFGKRDNLFHLLSDFNYIYLCADAHYFSIMKINKGKKKVLQVTTGSGGADPDINLEFHDIKKYIEFDGYNIEYFLLNSYGYSTIRIYKYKIVIIYKQVFLVDDSDMSGNTYIYSIKRGNDGDVTFEKHSKIKKQLSQLAFKKYKYDKSLTCEHISRQIENIEDNVVTSQDKTKYCFKKNKID